MRILNATMMAVSIASLISCGQSKKDEPKKTEHKSTVNQTEMEHRGEIYKGIPQAAILRVEIDPKTGEEIDGTGEFRQSQTEVTSSDASSLAGAFAKADASQEVEENSDDYNDKLSSSSASFRLIPWWLRTPMYRWGFREGYNKGSNSGNVGSASQAYYGAGDGYTGKIGEMPPFYRFGRFTPRCIYGGYNWHYGPRYVRDNGNYRYYTYAPQGAQYYNDGVYDEVQQNPYKYGNGIYGNGSYVNGSYQGGYQNGYNNWQGQGNQGQQGQGNYNDWQQ